MSDTESNREECAGCQDDYPRDRLLQIPCRHRYCAECLSELFKHAMKTESLYSPKCCRGQISWASVRASLPADSELVHKFEAKLPELECDPGQRVYGGDNSLRVETIIS